MHEISLVRNIFRTIEEAFPSSPPENIKRIFVKAGELSNVQPLLMQSAFEAVLADDPRYQRAALDVEVLPIMVKCDTCHATTKVEHYKFVCSCGIPTKNIVQGDELLISKVEFFE